MTRTEFHRTAAQCGLDLARYAAALAGVKPAIIDLWSMTL